MPTPSAQFGLPQIAGTDSPDIPRDTNALIARWEALRNTFATRQILDMGQVGQIRAGRVLTPADFTNMGLTAPIGLYNLSTTADSSGNGRGLTNKGTVPFTTGIMGAAAEAAQFVGATTQALYRADTGAADPFRIVSGSWGCWFRTAKRGVTQYLISKIPSTGASADLWFELHVQTTNAIVASVGSSAATGVTDVADDRWHFAVATNDNGRLRIYLDGFLEANFNAAPMVVSAVASPLNIGSYGADATTASASPHYGRVDEAFVTSDVLNEDQVRYLYAASLSHTVASLPTALRLGVRRRRRGGSLATADFPATPVRLHNFAAGALTDAGSGGVALTLNAGTGFIVPVSAPDGTRTGAYFFSGAHTGASSTDTGLPAGTASRSYGCWFKTINTAGNGILISWGTPTTADASLSVNIGALRSTSAADVITGPFVAGGLWHFAVITEDNAAADGVRRKLYLNGRCVAGSTVLNAITLAGANRFRVGAYSDGTLPFTGQVSRAFVFAGVLTGDQITTLYNVGQQVMPPASKDPAEHVEAIEAARLLAVFDTLDSADSVDLVLAA